MVPGSNPGAGTKLLVSLFTGFDVGVTDSPLTAQDGKRVGNRVAVVSATIVLLTTGC